MDFNLNKNNPLLKQHIITCGRHELIRQERDEPNPIWLGRAVISINDTDAELAQMKDCFWGCNGVTYFKFEDDDQAFTTETARVLYEFAYEHHHHNFLIHCYLGCSRSVAVAKWLAEFLCIDDRELSAVKSYNHHVYNTLKGFQNVWIASKVANSSTSPK